MAVDWDKHVLAPMMASTVFGEDVQPTYRPAAGGAFDVDGVFDRAYKGLVVDAGGEPAISTVAPVLGVRLAQFPAPPAQDDTVLIRKAIDGQDAVFMVVDVQPDGHGWARLILSRT